MTSLSALATLAVLLLTAGVHAQNQTGYVELQCTYPPFPTDIPDDTCLQQSFLDASACTDIDASLTNETLLYQGWQCCGDQGPFAPPPAVAVSFWVYFNASGVETNKCIASGACLTPCPTGQDYAIGNCDVRIPPFPSAR